EVLPNGVPDWDWKPVDVAPIVLLAGRLWPEMGIKHGLAAARLAGLRSLVVGGVYDPAYRPALDGARLLRPLRRSSLWRLMAASAVTVMAARWEEPFGLVAAEAQVA